MDVFNFLKSVSAYPVPMMTLAEIASGRGLYLTDEADEDTTASQAYKGAKADLLIWLSVAPNVSQGGQSYSFSEYERKNMRAQAMALYGEIGESASENKGVKYGYKGDKL